MNQTPDTAPTDPLESPYPYFGGKSGIADLVWSRFGNVPNYIEPFFGSGAVLLARPHPNGSETVNDKDGFISNFWRAVQAKPDEVAHWADWIVSENDLHARHHWLVERKESMQTKLEGDPDYYDSKIAGWWVWGMACWIGSRFCSGNGPWHVQMIDGVRQLVKCGGEGDGVNRQLVHLRDAGMGVNRKNASPLADWMNKLAKRFARVRVCCGDWTRVCGGRSGDALKLFFASGNRCAIFLDPPYSAKANRNETIYRVEDLNIAHAVREWAIRQGNDPRLRIALCGYEGEHVMPSDWETVEWKAEGGYSNQSDDENSNGKLNAHRERIWFSPNCLKPERDLFGV